MDFDFLRSATASSSAYRVVCGEMIIDSNMWNVHNEVLVAVVRDGYMTVEMGADTYSLSTGDIYFISPNQRYKLIIQATQELMLFFLTFQILHRSLRNLFRRV